MAHTPAPWKWMIDGKAWDGIEPLGDLPDLDSLAGADPCKHSVLGGVWHNDSTGGIGLNGDEPEADALLIAASPDMLEALENLENDDNSIPDHAWKMVQAAISKAKGVA